MSNTHASFLWKKNTIGTSYASLEVHPLVGNGSHTIYNPSGVSYFLAEDSSGTNEIEIVSDILSFRLGYLTVLNGTKTIARFVRVASGSIDLVVISKGKRD